MREQNIAFKFPFNLFCIASAASDAFCLLDYLCCDFMN